MNNMITLNIKETLIINTIMNMSYDTIYFKDINSRIILSSKAHAKLWGLDDPADAIGKTDFDFFPEEFARKALKIEQEIMATGVPVTDIIEELRREDGKKMWLSASKYPLYDTNGNIVGTWGTSKDITTLKETEEELKKVNAKLKAANLKLKALSSKDTLSGLYNKGHYFDVMKSSFEIYKRRRIKGQNNSFSLILFDIDNFKDVNDTYGHLMGDYMIRHISNIIRNSVRSSDTCCRYGGDEFAVLVYDTDLDDAIEIAEKIRKNIENSRANYMGIQVKVTASIGVSTFDESYDFIDMIDKADKRLYISKSRGKNKVSCLSAY
jgi:diguanylate cyclase (GGDEF)-like protein/PAS domain S-box-containing protein